MTKRLLELFCGTKSVGKVFESKGYEVISLDYNPVFNATHSVDINTWDYKIYPPDYFDAIWASPDCTTWSLASGGKYRTKDDIWGHDIFNDNIIASNQMVDTVINILKYFKCERWFIENPAGLLIHFPPLKNFIQEVNANVSKVYYGNYGWGFPKPTHIWSNKKLWIEKPPAMDKSLYTMHTYSSCEKPRRVYKAYSFKTPEERSKIPERLIERLYQLP
jgi:site-specific DNA-cytosine methylase